MNMDQILFKRIALALCLISIGTYGQKQTKSYKENFMVTETTLLDINTSNADIEFETWDKPQIQVEATIVVEGVSDSEAENYFKNSGLQIIGNSKKVTVSTGSENGFHFANGFDHGKDFQIAFSEMPIMHLDSLSFAFDVITEMPELMEAPPMPPMPPMEFDYKAFEKDGEKYLKKWQKEFSKGFNKDYEKKMEEWSARMEAKRSEMEEKRELMREKRMEAQEKLIEQRAELRAQQADQRAQLAEARQARNEAMEAVRAKRASSWGFYGHNDSLWGGPNMFYFSTDGENKNYKVKKTIKIKMPKSTKIQMNVRHGEVKLAGNTKNLNAKLSYASLVAATIDGDATIINASYSPVTVQKWNYGQLQANYSELVDLKEVLNLRLSAISSDVVIDNLLKSAYIKNEFGPIRINAISNDFKELDVSMKNGDLDCALPTAAFTIYVQGTSSRFTKAKGFKLEETKNLNSFVQKGYNISNNSNKSITINSEYSNIDIALKQ